MEITPKTRAYIKLCRYTSLFWPEHRRSVREYATSQRPWFTSRVIMHMTPTLFAKMTYCLLPVGDVDSAPVRSPIPLTCPRCVLLARRGTKDYQCES